MTDRRPHVAVISSVWPHIRANREAANVINYLMLWHLAKAGEYRLTFQYLNWSADEIPLQARDDIRDLEANGIAFVPPIILGAPTRLYQRPVGAALSAATGHFQDLVAGADRRHVLAAAIAKLAPDLVLTVWSEIAQNLTGPLPVLKAAYAGNPDYKVFEAFRELRALGPPLKVADRLRARINANLAWLGHRAVMRGFDRVFNVALNDAKDYRQLGINADYIQNMWPPHGPENWLERRDRLEQEVPLRIVGNVGNLSATGNSFGLLAIARELLPRLKAQLGEGRFQIHLFGGGPARPEIAPLLDDPHIIVRGFVDDLDAEIMAAPIFLVANNHHRFKVGHTRYLHAWSLGSCCVGFDDIRLAMPEIRHEENALLAADADKLVAEITRAASDRALRRRIGAGGIETLQRDFAPARVVARVATEIDGILAR